MFDDNGSYDGTGSYSAARISFTDGFDDMILTNLPSDTYTVNVEITQTNYSPAQSISNNTFTLGSEDVQISPNVEISYQRQIFYYYDTTGGKIPETYIWFSSNSDLKYSLEIDNGTYIYTYDPEGDIDRITVKSGVKTVVLQPSGARTIYHGYVPNGNAYLPGFINGTYEDGIWKTNGDSWSFVGERATLHVSAESYSVYEYTKTDGNGDDHDADFYITSDDHQNSNRYILEHYDAYTYNGEEYTNVYIVTPNTMAAEDADDSTVIHSDNGKFTVLYPSYGPVIVDDSYILNRQFYLYEISDSCDAGHYPKNLDNSYSYGSHLEWHNQETATIGVSYNGDAGQFAQNVTSMHGLNITSYIDYAGFDYDDLSVSIQSSEHENTIENYINPYIRKIVLSSSGQEIESDELFTFNVYGGTDSNTASYSLIGSFQLQAGQEVQLTRELVPGLTDQMLQGSYYYVKERDKAGYILVSNPSVPTKTTTGHPTMVFQNKATTTRIYLYKGITNGMTPESARFTIAAEFDGAPLNGTYSVTGSNLLSDSVQFVNGKDI